MRRGMAMGVVVFVLWAALPGAQSGVGADFDEDGRVGFSDFLAFAGAYGSGEARFDLNGNGRVDFPDFLAFAGAFQANAAQPSGPLPAFPGAEGFGSTTAGGRGGRVIAVTTLEASGPGSFRAACEASGPRTIVFRVGGTIYLEREISIREPFVTIAGQTAPGDGVCLRGAGLRVATHDVIVRGLRIRVGDHPSGPSGDGRDGLGAANPSAGEVYNVIFDHCSVSWAIDENTSTWYACRDITFQWCVISEALHNSLHSKGAHSMGLLVGDHAKGVSVHHCVFAHNNARNPLLKGNTEAEVINNVVYNWGGQATGFSDPEGSGPQRTNIVGNVYIPGPQSGGRKGIRLSSTVKTGTRVYVQGNVGPGRPIDEGLEWTAVDGEERFQSPGPAIVPSGVTTLAAEAAFELVMAHAGATAPKRDAADVRVLASIRERSGRIIDSQGEVGGWPAYQSGPAPTDGDGDGIPDVWERENGLDPEDARDGAYVRPGGYSGLEEYVNGLIVVPWER